MLNKKQRYVLFACSAALILVQLNAFSEDGVRGYGWMFPILAATGLIVFGLYDKSKEKPPTAESTSPFPQKSEAELAAIHQFYKDNAVLLSSEIERLAVELEKRIKESFGGENLIAECNEFDQEGKVVGRKAIRLADFSSAHVLGYAYWLVLGLVGMRRAMQVTKGKEIYVTSLEYRTLERLVGDKVIGQIVRQMKDEGATPEQLEKLAQSDYFKKEFLDDMLSIRKAVANYCKGVNLSEEHPEKFAIHWFLSKTGVQEVDKELVAEALAGSD